MKDLSDFDLIPGYLVRVLRNDAQHISLSIWNTQSLVDARQTTRASMVQSLSDLPAMATKIVDISAIQPGHLSIHISYPTLKTGRSLFNIAVPRKNGHIVSSRAQDIGVLTRIRA
ncbi:hypothetical protein DXG01_013020 [Tephrocybe rancida]|nr:hypothetical protein DXG01_013020 [Tephrocybe rancida]